jgi:hypothetical protein
MFLDVTHARSLCPRGRRSFTCRRQSLVDVTASRESPWRRAMWAMAFSASGFPTEYVSSSLLCMSQIGSGRCRNASTDAKLTAPSRWVDDTVRGEKCRV